VDGFGRRPRPGFLTAISYAELSDIYPKAGSGSSYYFAEAALLEKRRLITANIHVLPNLASAGFPPLYWITPALWWPSRRH